VGNITGFTWEVVCLHTKYRGGKREEELNDWKNQFPFKAAKVQGVASWGVVFQGIPVFIGRRLAFRRKRGRG